MKVEACRACLEAEGIDLAMVCFKVWGLGFQVFGLGCRVSGLGFKVLRFLL